MEKNKLETYISLLRQWNRVINLTAIEDEAKIRSHHIADSLSVLPFVQTFDSLCDVGSGAGFPGIPLALARPQMAVTLVEANHKKGAFLKKVVRELSLSNVQVVVKRVEAYFPESLFGAIITRAYAHLGQMLQQTAHLCDNGGSFLAMKGQVTEEELQGVPASFQLQSRVDLVVPGCVHRSLWIFAKR